MVFNKIPNVVIKHIVLHAVIFFNAYVNRQGISDEFLLREFILQWQLNWKKDCRGQFRAYCQAFNDLDSTQTNTQALHSQNAICLGPMGSMQGTYKFLDLATKQVIKRKFTMFPMPDSMKLKIKCWGHHDRQTGCLRFCDHHNEPFQWTDEHESLIEDNATDPEPALLPDIPMEIPGVAMESHYVVLPTPAIEEVPKPTIKVRTLAVAANANFGPRLAEFTELGNLTRMTHEPNDYLMINVNVIPAEPEVKNSKNFHNKDDNDDASLPSWQQLNSASSEDDSTYVHDEVDTSDDDAFCMTLTRMTARTMVMKMILKGVKGTTGHFP